MSDRSDIVITGIGLATPAGDSAESTWAALLSDFAISDHARAAVNLTPSPRRGEGGGEGCDVPRRTASVFSNTAVLERANIARRRAFLPSSLPSPRWGEGGRGLAERRLIELGMLVAREAMAETGLAVDSRTALVVGTSKGPADDWLVPLEYDPYRPPTSDKPSNGKCEDVTITPNIGSITKCEDVTFNGNIGFIGDIPIMPDADFGLACVQTALASRLGISGPVLTTSAACASSLHALIRAAMLLQHGDADRAIVVGTESSLHPAFIESFTRLGVIANPGQPCRPMDRNRSGFLISEAAAAVCLERRPARPGEIVLDGFALGSDASHLTHTDTSASTLKYCLKQVIAGRPVDLIHAHATGTVSNDVIELGAIAEASANTPPGGPILYSHKGALGHSLGASGLVATVLNVLSHRHGLVPGNVNTTDPMETPAGRIENKTLQYPIRRSLVIAAGFGGATGVVGLRSADPTESR